MDGPFFAPVETIRDLVVYKVKSRKRKNERVREREREIEWVSVRDERGAHSYNSCTFLKKTQAATASRWQIHCRMGYTWSANNSDLIDVHFILVTLFRSKAGRFEKVQRGYLNLTPMISAPLLGPQSKLSRSKQAK
jgi:hypothetical protein